jgi:Ser/Thr protein kinase RdoA (MazF antagonist)
MRFEQLPSTRDIDAELRILRQVAYGALARYGIQPSSIRLLQYEDNAVYSVITEKSRYILRISAADGHPVEQQRSELVWLDALADEPGLQTPRPIKTPADELLVEIPVSDGVNRVCVLFEWIYGTAAPSYVTGVQAMMCGRATALLHAQSLRFAPLPPFMRPSLGWDELCGPLAVWRREKALARLKKSDSDVLEQIADKIGMQLSALPESSIATCAHPCRSASGQYRYKQR